MQIEQLTSQISVSGQIGVDDVKAFKEMGVELLVCNRPDDEDAGQTPHSDVELEAFRIGLPFKMLPFSSYQITEADRDEFVKLIETRKRIHCYCRSGSRSKRLWREANSLVGGESQYNESCSNS